ncbi:MAG: hypothetical protein HRU23_10715 [Gammaproteobacteria bacterium]|nr:hypothetical protein [Gammaproteobacteria bacterium]
MGFFSGIKNTAYKSKALTHIRLFLDAYEVNYNVSGNNLRIANHLVNETYDQNPQLFDGKYGSRPHDLILAAMTFVFAINMSEGREFTEGDDVEKILNYREAFIDGLYFTSKEK